MDIRFSSKVSFYQKGRAFLLSGNIGQGHVGAVESLSFLDRLKGEHSAIVAGLAASPAYLRDVFY